MGKLKWSSFNGIFNHNKEHGQTEYFPLYIVNKKNANIHFFLS